MKPLTLGLALLLAPAAGAQQVNLPIDSPWGAWAKEVKVTLAASPLRRDVATGALEAIAGQKVPLGPIAFLQKSLAVTFPGQKGTPMTVAGLRLHHAAAGTGWAMPDHPVNVTFPAPLVVPAGRKLFCVYQMPLATKGKLMCRVE